MVKGAKEMQIDRVRCLFEQSGTFKDEFAKFGIIAYDYDIRNDFKKPTQYWFVNCVPENNLNFGFCLDYQAAKKKVLDLPTVERSMISPTYAYNFIRDFIITQ